MEGSLSAYRKGGSVSIAINGFWQPDQIKFSSSSSSFSPSVCKSHNLCPDCSSLQYPDCSRHWGLGLYCLCFDSSSLCPWVLCRVKSDWVWSLDASRNCVTTWMFSLTFSSLVLSPSLFRKPLAKSQSDQPGEIILILLPMGREWGNKASPKQTEQKPLFYVQALLSNNDLLLTTPSCLCLSSCLFMTFTHYVVLNWACIFLTHRSCIFIHSW